MSTFHQLWERGAFAGDVTEPMVLAADRQLRGSRLGPGARRSLRKFQKALRNEQIIRQREDWDAHDKRLREEWARNRASPPGTTGTGGTPSSAARPGAVPVPAAPRPPGPVAGTTQPGQAALRRSSFDARHASNDDFKLRLQQLGVSAEWYEDHAQPPPKTPSLGIRVKQERLEREATAAAAARATELDRTKIDGRSAKPEEVANRVAELLGPHADRDIVESFRPGGRELEPPAPPKIPKSRREAERRDAEILGAAKRGGVDARQLSGPEAFRRLLQLRGLAGGP